MDINTPENVAEDHALVKNSVQSFYDEIGWQQVQDGLYQNATYEDLRPVSKEYIHRCHLRVLRHLKPRGQFLLDAGSGPIQYVEYLEYSRNYQRRICVDISTVALREARKRIGEHGFFVVADVANLPFRENSFDGVVSLHTIHHLPEKEHVRAYRELHRMLKPGSNAVIVDGWSNPPLMNLFDPLIRFRYWLSAVRRDRKGKSQPKGTDEVVKQQKTERPRGTFVRKYNALWLKSEVGKWMPVRIYCWRSVSVKFLRAFVHPRFGGRLGLKILFWLEDRLPQFFGEVGQYPLVVLHRVQENKPQGLE